MVRRVSRVFRLACATRGCGPHRVEGDSLRAMGAPITCPGCGAEWPIGLSLRGPADRGQPDDAPAPVVAAPSMLLPPPDEPPMPKPTPPPAPAGIDRIALAHFRVGETLMATDKRLAQVAAWQRMGLVSSKPSMTDGGTLTTRVELTAKGRDLLGIAP